MNTEAMIDDTDTKLVPIKTTIAEYSPKAEALAKLEHEFKDRVFPRTPEGEKEARAARKSLVTLRTSTDKLRKELKAPISAKLAAIDSEYNEIEAAVIALEDPIDLQVKEMERIETERKEAKAKAAKEKADRITAALESIRRSSDMVGKSSADISAAIERLKAREITLEEFDDQAGTADMARTDALDRLETLLEASMVQEAQQAEIARQREELEALRKAQKAIDDAAAAARAESERKEREAREERARKDREAIEAERAALKKERDEMEARLAEQRRKDEERQTEIRRQQDELNMRQRADQEQKDREAEEAIARADRVARKEREDREAAELAQRKQREREEDEARQQRLRDEEAAALAKSKAERAAVQMLEALQAWVEADAKNPDMTLRNAKSLRDKAIKAATE